MQQNVTEAMALLGIKSWPFSSLELSTNFNAISKVVHKKDKIILVAAFKLLQTKVVDKQEVELDPEQSYKICKTCSGVGVLKTSIWKETVCSNCKGTKKVTLKCRYCQDGKFAQKSGKLADCRACNGTGVWRIVNCNKCNSQAAIKDFFNSNGQYIDTYTPCNTCFGAGKVQGVLFNPVLSVKMANELL